MNLEKYVRNLSDDIRESLEWYTGGHFDTLNAVLRSEKSLTSIQQKHLDNINIAFAGAPPITSIITVYKGKDNLKVYSDKAFMSTTTSFDKSKDFADKHCCVLEITVSRGSKVLPLKSLSRYAEESEILLDRNGILFVTDQEVKSDGMRVLYCIYTTGIEIENKADFTVASKTLDTQSIITKIVGIFSPDELELYDTYDDLEQEVKKTYKKLYPFVSMKTELVKDIMEILLPK